MVLVDGVGGGVTVLGCAGRVSGTIKEKSSHQNMYKDS